MLHLFFFESSRMEPGRKNMLIPVDDTDRSAVMESGPPLFRSLHMICLSSLFLAWVTGIQSVTTLTDS